MTTATYDLEAVPERKGRSRFGLATSPTGVAIRPTRSILNAYEAKLAEHIARAEPLAETKTVQLRKIVRTREGYALVNAGAVRFEARNKAAKTGKHEKRDDHAGAYFDRLLLADDLRYGTDEAIYDEGLALAEVEGFAGSDLRALNVFLARLVLHAAGASGETLKPWNLPL